MAKIEKLTYDAIKKNVHKLSIVSQERIYEELKKAFKQVNNYVDYLNLLSNLDMWNEIFPNAIINTNIKNSKYFEIYLAQLFKDEIISNLLIKLKFNYSIDNIISRKVIFLIELLNLTYDNVLELHKKKIISQITDNEILEWYSINGISNKIFKKFIIFTTSVNAQHLMNNGLKGKELGDTIKQMEIENFKKLVNE